MDEHVPRGLELVFEALGHDTVLVKGSEFEGSDDGYLVRHLSDLGCDWLFALDLHRQEEVWVDVYSALAEESGRLLRLRPAPRRGVGGAAWIAHLAKYIVSSYENWSDVLDSPPVRMIELGRGVILYGARRRFRHGTHVCQFYDRSEVAELLQQRFQMGDPSGRQPRASIPQSPAPQRNVRTRRGNRRGR